MPSLYEARQRQLISARLERLAPEVARALQRLTEIGAVVKVIGSFGTDRFRMHSDVDLFVTDAGGRSVDELYEAAASEIREVSFDLVLEERLSPAAARLFKQQDKAFA